MGLALQGTRSPSTTRTSGQLRVRPQKQSSWDLSPGHGCGSWAFTPAHMGSAPSATRGELGLLHIPRALMSHTPRQNSPWMRDADQNLDREHGAQPSQERAIWVLHGGRRRSAPGWTQVTLWWRGATADTCNSGKPVRQAKARLPWTIFGHTTLNTPNFVRLPWTDCIPGPRTPSNPRQGCLLALSPPGGPCGPTPRPKGGGQDGGSTLPGSSRPL